MLHILLNFPPKLQVIQPPKIIIFVYPLTRSLRTCFYPLMKLQELIGYKQALVGKSNDVEVIGLSNHAWTLSNRYFLEFYDKVI